MYSILLIETCHSHFCPPPLEVNQVSSLRSFEDHSHLNKSIYSLHILLTWYVVGMVALETVSPLVS